MSRKTNELVKAISPKKKQVSKKTQVATWLKTQVWDSRPINWLAVLLACVSVSYVAYYIAIPEFNGIATFIVSIAVISRAFKK